MEDIQNILSQISAIVKGYNRIRATSSDNYNIFKILNLQTDEVSLHSLFLAELLNPKGSHKKGTVFLKEFLKTISPDLGSTLDLDSVNLTVEKFIGPISKDKTTGGRIDILIEDNDGKCIIIENKIYAGDQEKQLLRYHNYKGDREGIIFYLTINGCPPQPYSCCDLKENKDFHLISYKETINNWLEKCHQIASDSPFIRETIQQYINLIKSFSGQTIFKEMYQDIQAVVIQNQQNFESAFNIAANFEKIKAELLADFWDEFSSMLEEDLGNNYKVHLQKEKIKNGDNYPGIFVNEISCHDLWLSQFVLEPLNGKSPWNINRLYFGIWVNSTKEPVTRNLSKLQALFDRKSKNSNWWLIINNLNEFDFNSAKTLKLILPGTTSRLAIQKNLIGIFGRYIRENKGLMEQIVQIMNQKN
jgi:hypothetical protein